MRLAGVQGEACECGARLFVHESLYDKFVKRSGGLAEQRKASGAHATQLIFQPRSAL
jgi:acyl-CoA reductase-like NAD-dependent aldehyde dehydrogenase